MTEENFETIRLYDTEPYATEFEAKVISCDIIEENRELRYELILDQTLFFPEEGGQSPDTGFIHGIAVKDVQIRNNIITHITSTPIEPGTTVSGKINWKHRYSNMQQHSGEHIFSGIVHRRFGFDNVGFHLSDQIVTMDFSGVITPEQVEEIEYEVNEVITRNLSVEVSYPDQAALAELDYRSKIDIDGQVRIVTIPGYDVCACCAPHVKQTGEIGMLKVMNVQSYKGGVRISILCGFRALEAFREKSGTVAELMNLLSSSQEALPENVNKLKNTIQSLKSQLASAKQELMTIKMEAIPADQKNVILFERELDNVVMRNTVNKLVEAHTGIAAVFSGNDADGYSFIIGSKEIDCREIAAMLKEKLNARGGGSAAMVQGSVTVQEMEIRNSLDRV